ncbi:MAG: hypothetical protein IKF64_08370 [Eubacterium sp.]|nr:hypothetical protein [Eubacterium sp.]
MASNKKKTAKKKTCSKKLNKKQLIALVTVIAVLIAGTFGIILASSTKNRTHDLYEFDKDKAYGIDVSSHNGKIEWKTVAKEVDFAFIRVGYRTYGDGILLKDKRAEYNLKNAEKAKIPFGVYVYSQAVNEKEAEEEAKLAIRQVKSYNIQLPIVIDFEYATKDGKQVGRLSDAKLSKKERMNVINAFCRTVKEAGYTPALYASSNIYKNQLSPKKLVDGTIIWVADYNKKMKYKGSFDIWQYSEKGSCKGVSSKYVDTNYWYK